MASYSMTTALVFSMLLVVLCPVRGKITLFEHNNFVGAKRTYTRSNPNIGSIFNDKTTSVKVTPGQIWILYEHSSYRGRSFIVRRNIPNVGRGFNDKTTSLIRLV